MTDLFTAPCTYGGPVIPAPRTLCRAPGPAHAAEVGYLCDEHLQQLNRWLWDVQREVGHLDPVPSGGDPFSPGGGGAPAFTRTPVRLDAVVLRDTRQGTGWAEDEDDRIAAGGVVPVAVVLGRWAAYVIEHRNLTDPPPSDVGEVRRLLSRHLDWLAAQLVIGRVYRQIGALRSALYRVNGTSEDQPLPGFCPELVQGQSCGGLLWSQHEDGPARVVCGRNTRHVWTGPAVAHLALRLRGQVPTPRES